MPTNRTRRTRKKKSAGSVSDFVEYFCSINYLCGFSENPMPGINPAEYWKKHKDEIMQIFMAKKRAWGKEIADRPEWYFRDLEKEHPRLKLFDREWHSARTSAGAGKWEIEEVFETDREYLARLGLLEDWELKFINNNNSENTQDERPEEDDSEAVS